MRLLNRDQILAARGRLKVSTVDVPEWGGKVCVRELTAKERSDFAAELGSWEGGQFVPRPGAERTAQAVLLVLSVVDEAGNRLFTPEDVPALLELGGAAIDRISAEAARLSGLRGDDREPSAQEVAEGN